MPRGSRPAREARPEQHVAVVSPRPRPGVAPGAAGPSHLSNLQILRGVAAVMVVLYHIGNEFADRGFPGRLPTFEVGSAGVDVFFVVSGFVMVHSTASAFGAAGAPALFLARRIVRLVPLYWLVTAVFAALLVGQTGASSVSGETWRWIAASYLFLFYPHGDQGGDFPLYEQGWTLNFEVFFYACFAAVLPLRRGVALWSLALGLGGLVALGLTVALPWPVDRWANTNIVEFVLGLGLAVVHARGWRLSPGPAIALAAAGFAAFAMTIGSVDDWLPYRGFVWGPPACAVVAAAALCRPERGGAVRTALERVGDASYALYLVHYAFFVGLGAAVGRFRPVESAMPPAVYGLLCFAGSVTLGLGLHRWVERPVTAGLNRAFDLPRRWRALTGPERPAG